jgi:hypothetical protein
MKTLTSILIAIVIPLAASGRLVPAITYQQMYDRADLVAIGRPISTEDTAERGRLPGGPTSWEVVGLSTEISISLVLKGDKSLNRFTLHHYRQADPGQELMDGPNFVTFSKKGSKAFLLFLKREPDGRYAPVSGQEDPALFAITELNGKAH